MEIEIDQPNLQGSDYEMDNPELADQMPCEIPVNFVGSSGLGELPPDLPRNVSLARRIDLFLARKFRKVIQMRGREYYFGGRVASCIRAGENGTDYFAKVAGSCGNKYEVEVSIAREGILVDCDCPCDFNCKHEYATLLAIRNHEYETLDLRPKIPKQRISLRELLCQIPAEELKNYFLSRNLDPRISDEASFRKHFIAYEPQQSYEYYYNRLYNALLLDESSERISHEYLEVARSYISARDFSAAFEIIRCIVEAYHDAEKLNDEADIGGWSEMEMMLRVIAAKSRDGFRDTVVDWFAKLEQQDYYGNVYLENMILLVRQLL